MFSDFAPLYWAKNLPAIPLQVKEKRPVLNAWHRFANTMPSDYEQSQWLEAFEDNNIGLALGPQSGVVALDLDSEDPRVAAILMELMPPTPWKRIGKKGAVFAFKFNGERTYRVRDATNATVFELLSSGAQIVLPPSIHPDTGRPYKADSNLYDVLDQLVPLPANFEATVRARLIDAGIKLTARGMTKITDWVPSGSRDSQMVAHAGLLARSVTRGERTVLEARHEIEVWVETYVEPVVGDMMNADKAVSKLMEFIRRDVTERGRALPAAWHQGMADDEVAKLREYFGEVVEMWTLDQFMTDLTEKFSALEPDAHLAREAVIEGCLARLSKSDNVSTVGRDTIMRFIVGACKNEVTMPSLRKRMGELTGGELRGDDHTQIAVALIKEMDLGGETRFEGGLFYQWAGSHWKPLDESEIIRKISEHFGNLPMAKKFNDHRQIMMLASKYQTAKLAHNPPPGINFANGFLTTDLELLPHDPRFGCTYCLPYRWVVGARSPVMFMSFLDRCWGHEPDYLDKVQALREAMASTLFGVATKFSRALCLFGLSRTGKSTTMKIMRGLVPDDAICTVPPQDWGDRFMPTVMNKKLINLCGELSENRVITGSDFKGIVEGEEISGQFKGQDIFRFKPMCAHWFATNHLPRSRDNSAGFVNRWLFLHFTNVVRTDEKNIDLHTEILSEEREEIVAWAVPAIMDLMRRHEYTLPASHSEISSEVASTNNTVRGFISSESVVLGEDQQIEENALFQLYMGYCRVIANNSPMAKNRFRQAVQELQQEYGLRVEVQRTLAQQGCTYYGIGVPRKAALRVIK